MFPWNRRYKYGFICPGEKLKQQIDFLDIVGIQ